MHLMPPELYKRILRAGMEFLCAAAILLAACCYADGAADAGLGRYAAEYAASWCGLLPFNPWGWKTAGLMALGVLAGLRLLRAGWNLLLCAGLPVVLAWLSAMAFGPHLLLPAPLDSCAPAVRFMELPQRMPALVAVVLCSFSLAIPCAWQRLRTAATTLAAVLLWFVCAELLWAVMGGDVKPDSVLYDTARMVVQRPWVCALFPGIFFGMFALIMAVLYAFFPDTAANGPQEAAPAPEEPDTPLPGHEEENHPACLPGGHPAAAPAPAQDESHTEHS